MRLYKYPIKYFCGSNLSRYDEKFLHGCLKVFDENYSAPVPIVGETGIDGVLLDFNCGLRLQIPEGNWHVRITESANGVICFDEDVSRVTLISLEKFCVEWEIAIWKDSAPVFCHQFDPTDQKIHFIIGSRMLDETLIFLPYTEEFRRTFKCEVSLTISEMFHELVTNYFSAIRLRKELPSDCYACIYADGFMNMPSCGSDVRSMPLEIYVQMLLTNSKIKRPKKMLYAPTKPREIQEPYVCIEVQASTPGKSWLNPDGWVQVVRYLKSIGYRVLCLDCDHKPDLIEQINQLAYADFFIGVSSGLSWLARAVDIPVVMISGITESWYEFDTPYRVNNPLVCHGCFNNLYHDFKPNVCPIYGGTAREFECSKKISARQVINAIDRLIADHNLEGRN